MMDDFRDLTPPPRRPLAPAQRERLRSRLSGQVTGSAHGRERRWVVPVVAAATAVALGVGGAVALARSVGGSEDGRAAAPAGRGSTPVPAPRPAPPTVSASPDPCAAVSTAHQSIEQSTKALDEVVSGAPGRCLRGGPPPSCARAVHEQLPGATPVATDATDGVSFWVAGSRWTLCFRDAEVTTVHHVRSLGAPPVGNQRFAFSTDIGAAAGGRMPTTFVAGGPLGGGDSRIDYVFPDGHVQEATYLDGAGGSRWWVVAYTARAGVLADPATNFSRLAPVVARLWGTDVSPPERYTLSWSADGCAQVNHGC